MSSSNMRKSWGFATKQTGRLSNPLLHFSHCLSFPFQELARFWAQRKTQTSDFRCNNVAFDTVYMMPEKPKPAHEFVSSPTWSTVQCMPHVSLSLSLSLSQTHTHIYVYIIHIYIHIFMMYDIM